MSLLQKRIRMNALLQNRKLAITSIWVFTVVVYALVISLHYLPSVENKPSFTSFQPLLNAIINGTCFILLISSLIAIKKKNIELHKKLNTTAMLLSVVFLLNYVLYHYLSGDTSYLGEAKAFFYFILITHILLAGISLPLILIAYYRGLSGDVERHRKIVKITYPIWLYVTFTGVMVYAFLSPYYA